MSGPARAAPPRWPRDEFAEAVWSSNLPALQRLVALAYADHARDGDTAWVKWSRLAERTGTSRSTAASALKALVAAGWLVQVEPARQHYSARYLLVPQESGSRTSQESGSRTSGTARGPAPDTRGPAPDTRGPAPGPNQKTDLQPDQPEEPPVLIDNENPSSDLTPPYGRPDWRPEWCAEAIEHAVAAGICTRADAPLLLQALADDPATTSPRRLTAPGGVKHAHALLGRGKSPVARGERSARPTWCGHCEKTTRWLEDPATRDPVSKCPRCHPDSRSHAA